MLNNITLMGRITREIECKELGEKHTAVCNNALAVARDAKEKETDFIDIVVFGPSATFMQKYLHKGDMVVVNGRLQIRSWKDKDGNARRTAEVVVQNLYPAGRNTNDAQANNDSQPANTAQDDDELPFG